MQVILASGRENGRIEVAFFGAGLVVVMAVLGMLCAVAGFFVALLLYNLVKTLRIQRRVKREDLAGQEKCG